MFSINSEALKNITQSLLTMCISNEKAEMSATNIFVAPNSDKTRQITVYANTVETQVTNMMILPVPNPDTVKFIDLSYYRDIFEDLDRPFRRQSRGLMLGSQGGVTRGVLKVETVGNFLATLIPSISDFERLDSSVFGTLSPVLQEILKKYYSTFGFVVCRLKTGTTEYHPFAYSHAIQESGKLFVPTRHYHGDGHEERISHWDHSIYSANTNVGDLEILNEKSDRAYLQLYKFDSFELGPITVLNRCRIKHAFMNEDIQLVMV